MDQPFGAFYKSDDVKFLRNTLDDPAEDPCGDCGRDYLIKESVAVRVEGRPDPVWEGCIDCWVRRTSPAMCETFVEKESLNDILVKRERERLRLLGLLKEAE